MGNLVVNADDPWTPYHGQKDPYVVDEIMDGSWFHDTVAKYRLTDSEPFFVLPIIAYTDKTGTDLQNRYPLEPVTFTTAILRRHVRNMPRSWRLLGYIPQNDSVGKSEMRSGTKSSYFHRGRNTRIYHAQMRALLQSLIDVQTTQPHQMFIRVGKKAKKVRVYFPVAFFSGDSKSQDNLACRVQVFRDAHLSRACSLQFDKYDDPRAKCSWTNSAKIDKLLDVATLPGDETPGKRRCSEDLWKLHTRYRCRSVLSFLGVHH
jgi:hypothetical protein